MPPIASFKRNWRIRFVDTDASGFAHYATYFRLMEETEYAFLRSRELSVVLYDQNGTLGFPRISAEVNVLRPLRFDQSVEVHLKLVEIDGKQIVYVFDIVDESETTAVQGKFVAACCRFPDQMPPFAVLIPPKIEMALRGDW